MIKVVVGASSFAKAGDEAKSLLESKGVEVCLNPYGRKLNKPETIDFVRNADGLLAGLETLDDEVFSNAKHLKAIARIGIGMENVDRAAADKYNIKVSNTPDAPTEAVAEMALTALLCLSRKMHIANANLHKGIWQKELGISIHGKTVLFIGYGRIGQALAELLKQFNMNILIYDPAYPDKSCHLIDGISQADIITIHASGNSEILGKNEFSIMKQGVIILNSSRGLAVSEECLHKNIVSGLVAGAWLDVFPEEPYAGELCKLGNVLLTPHISSNTDKCRKEMEIQAVNNLIRDMNL